MLFNRLGIFLLISTLAACGGSGSGSIDYSSPTVVQDLQTQLAAIDSNVTVVSNGDGSMNLTSGSDTIVIKPGTASSAVITLSGTMYNVQISASGEYTYSPANNPSSTAAYITSASSMMGHLDDVSTKLGVNASTGVVDLTTGTKNASAKPVPDTVTLSGTGTSSVSGNLDGVTTTGTLRSTQTMTLTHNLTDDSVKAAHTAGWDGTGVNVTILDSKIGGRYFAINETITGTVTATDGTTTESQAISESSTSQIQISHGTFVEGVATGLNWQAALEGAYSVEMDSQCSASNQTSSSGSLSFTTSTNISSNYCGKLGVATGSNTSFLENGVDSNWVDLLKLKNQTGKIEILNYSFGSATSDELNFADNKNVLLVVAAGNESEPPNGYDIFADGKNVDGSSDVYETFEIDLVDSPFANNMLVVGAINATDTIENYSTIAGPAYDGSSWVFLVDDGNIDITATTVTRIDGNLTFSDSSTSVSGTYDATYTESLDISTDGTSYSAPRVTGKMAITSQKFPNLNAEQLVNLAKHTAIDLGDTGVDQIYGHGKINLTGMLSPIGRLN